MTYFYRDGGNLSFVESLRVQVQAAGGAWVDASGEVPVGTEGAPVIDVPISAYGVSADASAASIEVDGTPIAGFDPEVTDYEVAIVPPLRNVVTAAPTDPYAAMTIDRPDRRTTIVTITSEDGSQVRAYRIELVRQL